MSRLPSGGLLDRSVPLRFSFDGRALTGFAGDTLASALVANDVKLVGRSFKYHRPRGILTASSEEPNALVTLGNGAYAEPNTPATLVALVDGLVARSQNRWPSLRFDALAVNQLFAPMLMAGFYYKTFMWPPSWWEKFYEPVIRRAAGLGALSGADDPDRYDRDHAFCDLLVIGGGPAGLAAALTAGRAGLRVIVAEQDWRLGGRLLAERHSIDGAPAMLWVDQAANELGVLPNVTLLARTLVFGVYDGRVYGAVEQLVEQGKIAVAPPPRQRLWKIVAKHALLASGAIERPLVFGGNDRPGVMMASAVSAYLNRFAALPGKRAVVFTTTDSGWRTAEDLIDAGVEVAAVVDARPVAPPISPLLRQAGVPLLLDAVVRRAGGAPLRAVEVQSQDGATRRFAADLLAVSGGWNPAIALTGALGARPAWSDRLHCFLADMTPPGMQVIGAAAGRYAVADALADGVRCAAEIVVALGLAANMPALPKVESEPIGAAPLWRAGNAKDKAFVDFQHDVTDQDIALARREGFVSVEHLKRYTTLGMATDQGRTSQVNGIALLAAATGSGIAETGTILSRPPIQPISIGVLAGQQRGAQFRPQRHTASHLWATEQGASFADAGLWKRARWFSRPDEANWLQTVNREVVAVRNAAGFCDVSTLGKIDLFGVDAGLLLDRLYINSISTLAVGKVRYGVMLREDGFVMDDGTITRFGQEHFYITTTTLNAAKVMQHIDYARQVLWPELDTQAVSVTEQWATTAVAGPLSRALLQRLLPDLDLSAQAFPLMAAMRFAWHGTPSRLSRVSFSGELAYEISVPAHHGDRLVRAIAETGQAFGAVPYGTEALGVLRIEKGHPAGNELNGQTTAGDLGMARLMSNKKDYIGRVMATRPALTDEDRPSLVGLRPLDAKARLRAGAHLLPAGKPVLAAHDEGHVTSVAFSPTLGHWIGLGLLRRGRLRHGERILMHDPVRKGDAEVSVCSPVFVDPDGGRLRV